MNKDLISSMKSFVVTQISPKRDHWRDIKSHLYYLIDRAETKQQENSIKMKAMGVFLARTSAKSDLDF